MVTHGKKGHGLKAKDLVGIPWRVAFALQADGWYLRSDIVWAKPNPMPESVTDRPTKAHEYLFLFAHPDSGGRYFYDAEAIKERATSDQGAGIVDAQQKVIGQPFSDTKRAHSGWMGGTPGQRNKRTVWPIPTKPFPGAHFAVMPPDLVIPCVKAGTSQRGCCGDCGAPFRRMVERTPMEIRRSDRRVDMGPHGQTQASGTMLSPASSRSLGWEQTCECGCGPVPCTVLDPFAGAGTVGVVATGHGRDFVGIELNPEYAEMARQRIANPGVKLRIAEVAEGQIDLLDVRPRANLDNG